MSNGYAANFADIITEKSLKAIVPQEFKNFKNLLKQQDDMIEFMDQLNYQNTQYLEQDPDLNNLVNATITLIQAFKRKTNLDLVINYHDQENQGDKYDDVNGIFFSLDNIYQLTEDAKKFQEKYNYPITRAFYVTCG